jgi:hypothetical protein
MEIKVELEQSLRPNLPNVLASATVTITTEAGPFKISDCRLIQNKNGIVWFSLPSFAITHGQRQFEYRQTFEVPPAVAQQISAEALHVYGEWTKVRR